MTKVAVLGLGAMGARMAQRLLDAGHTVAVFNRTASVAAPWGEKGARVEATPAAAAEEAEVVIGMVTDDDASRAIWTAEQGALQTLRPGALAVASSTLSPRWVTELGAAVSEAGGELLDAPVAGSRPQAEAGQLIFVVGGEATAVDRARPLLEVLGGAVHHVGPTGTGAVMKLAINSLFAVQVTAMAEVLALCSAHGLNPAAALETLSQTPVVSPAAKGAGGLMVAERFAPLFPVSLVEKDLRYARGAAEGLALIEATRARYAAAVDAGHGRENINAIAKLYR